MDGKRYKIPFNKPSIVGQELYYIAEAVRTNWHLAGDGPFSRKCEEWLERAVGCAKALLTHSCTAALEMAAALCGVKPGDEIIMPSFTFPSTANAFVLRGAVPVFVDIRVDNLNIDEKLIPQAITSRTRGIVPVHYAGVPCEMDEIIKVAREHDLWVVEDAAHALLSTYRGRYLGTIGDLGCFSFHETKNIISGEGGALILNLPHFVEQAEILREKGTNRSQFFRGQIDQYTWVDIGSSYLPSDLVAGFLFAQMEHAERIIEARCKLVDKYNALLQPLEDDGRIRLPLLRTNGICNGHMYYIITQSPEQRSRLINHLSDRGICAVIHYVPLHSSPAGRRYGRAFGQLSVTEDLSMRLLRLPIYFDMTFDDVATVAAAVTEFFVKER